jgi:hypothetical protein
MDGARYGFQIARDFCPIVNVYVYFVEEIELLFDVDTFDTAIVVVVSKMMML